MINETAIRDRLVQYGEKGFKGPPKFINFSENEDADRLVNDLENYSHAYVLACIMDRQIKAERAWIIPFKIMEKLGDFSMETLMKQSESDFIQLMTRPEPLHRFGQIMGVLFFKGVHRIADRYGGTASEIWKHRPPSAAVVYRFLEFEGIGPKIASMASNILATNFKIEFSDYYSIDISPDVHVKRVFARLGLTSHDTSSDGVVIRARSLHPEFPGIMDYPMWEIGREWCRPRNPQCSDCFMNSLCPSVAS